MSRTGSCKQNFSSRLHYKTASPCSTTPTISSAVPTLLSRHSYHVFIHATAVVNYRESREIAPLLLLQNFSPSQSQPHSLPSNHANASLHPPLLVVKCPFGCPTHYCRITATISEVTSPHTAHLTGRNNSVTNPIWHCISLFCTEHRLFHHLHY